MEEMLTYGVLLLLDLNLRAVLESPLDNVGLLRGTFDVLRTAESRPELGEVLDLDQVPDGGERGTDDGRLADGGGGGDGRHGESFLVGCWRRSGYVLLVLRKRRCAVVYFVQRRAFVAAGSATSLALRTCPARGSHLLANITARL
jgi:hypothetical protein